MPFPPPFCSYTLRRLSSSTKKPFRAHVFAPFLFCLLAPFPYLSTPWVFFGGVSLYITSRGCFYFIVGGPADISYQPCRYFVFTRFRDKPCNRLHPASGFYHLHSSSPYFLFSVACYFSSNSNGFFRCFLPDFSLAYWLVPFLVP